MSEEWYLAEGTTRSNFDEWITIQNPNNQSCGVTIDYSFGPKQGNPLTQTYTMSPNSRLTINVNDPKTGVGPNKDVSAHITCDEPVVLERPMYFNYGGNITGGHIASGYIPQADQ